MMFVHIFKLLVIYSLIKFILSEFVGPEQQSSESSDEENLVLDSVYDTMKHNYEIKLRQNLHKLNLISDIRNKRNINEPMTMTPMNTNMVDYYKNHQYEVNRKNPVNFPLGFKTPPRLPIMTANPIQSRSDYEYEEYHKCPEKPTVQTFHISDNDHEKQHHLPGISTVLLTGIKYLLGGFAILALPFIVLKALFLPLKFLFFLKAFAIAKTFLTWIVFLRLLRFRRRIGFNNNNNFNNGNYFVPGKNKLQTIKDILNSEEAIEEDVDYKSEDEDVMSKESVGAPQLFHNPFNSTEAAEEFVQNLVKLMKLKNKNW